MLKNKTKDKIVSNEIILKEGLEKTLGLMLKKEPETILFKTRLGIHTFFVKFPIDVLVLDKNMRVRVLKEKLEPNRVMFWNLRFDTVIELPVGFINKSKTELNDLLEFDL